MATQAAAAASVPHTAPRRASGPGRIASQFWSHHSLTFRHTVFVRVQRDIVCPPPVTTFPQVPRFREKYAKGYGLNHLAANLEMDRHPLCNDDTAGRKVRFAAADYK